MKSYPENCKIDSRNELIKVLVMINVGLGRIRPENLLKKMSIGHFI